MADNRKYYYLKLKESYFDDDAIVLLESMQDGVIYSNILLKLYLKSLKNGGKLQLDENIPYTAQMIATITRQQVGTVERALKIFMKLGLVEPLPSGALYMSNIELLIGQSSTEGERKRRARLALQEQKALPQTGADKCPPYRADICPPEIEIEKEIERIDYQQIADMYNEICISFPKVKTLSAARKKAIKARLNTYRVDDFKNLFQKAEASDFLKGRNNRDWSANFDWLIKDASMAKVLDGNYDNKGYSESKAPVSAGVDYGVFNKNQSPVTLDEDEYF